MVPQNPIPPKTITLMSLDNVKYSLPYSTVQLSSTLNELIKEGPQRFDSSQPIPITLNKSGLRLLVSCLNKIAALKPSQDEAAYKQAVASALDPFFSDKRADAIFGFLSNYFFAQNNISNAIELIKESNRLHIPVLLNYLVCFIAQYLQNTKDLNELTIMMQLIVDLAPDIRNLIKTQLLSEDGNEPLIDELLNACTQPLVVPEAKFISKLVTAVAISPNGNLALIGSNDKIVRLWDLKSGIIKVLVGHTDCISSIAFSPDGKQALTGSEDFKGRLWNLDSGETITMLKGHASVIYAIAFSPDGKQALTASDDGTARLWDLKTGETIQVLDGHTSSVTAIAFSADGKKALTGSRDATVRLWDLTTAETKLVLQGHKNMVLTVAFTTDDNCAFTASEDDTVLYWDLKIGTLLKTFKHQDWIRALSFSKDFKHALTVSVDAMVSRIWNLDTGQTLRELYHSGGLRCAAFSPNEKQVLTGGWDQALVWNLAIMDTLSLPQLVALIKLRQENMPNTEQIREIRRIISLHPVDHTYLRQLFDVSAKLKDQYHNDTTKKSITPYKKTLMITASLAIGALGSYLLMRYWPRHNQ